MHQERVVLMEVTDKGAVYVDGTRVTGRETKWGVHRIILSQEVKANEVGKNLESLGFGHVKLDPVYAKEQNIS